MIRREHLEEIVRKSGGRIIWHRGTKKWMNDDVYSAVFPPLREG